MNHDSSQRRFEARHRRNVRRGCRRAADVFKSACSTHMRDHVEFRYHDMDVVRRSQTGIPTFGRRFIARHPAVMGGSMIRVMVVMPRPMDVTGVVMAARFRGPGQRDADGPSRADGEPALGHEEEADEDSRPTSDHDSMISPLKKAAPWTGSTGRRRSSGAGPRGIQENRSRFMTLSQAATKSWTKFSAASSLA